MTFEELLAKAKRDLDEAKRNYQHLLDVEYLQYIRDNGTVQTPSGSPVGYKFTEDRQRLVDERLLILSDESPAITDQGYALSTEYGL